MTAIHYASYTDARTNLMSVLDASEAGLPVTVARDSRVSAVVDAVRLRRALCMLVPTAVAVAEDDGWSLLMPGLPIAADGVDLFAAADDLIAALREYADDWRERLHDVPNHRDNWGLVQMVDLSDDEQLRSWIQGEPQ